MPDCVTNVTQSFVFKFGMFQLNAVRQNWIFFGKGKIVEKKLRKST